MKDDVQTLWLVGGTALLVSGPAQVSREHALDSILYAQLVADKHQGSRFADYASWYKAYRTGLQSSGWVVSLSKADYQADPVAAPLRFLAQRLEDRHPGGAAILAAAVARLDARDAQQYLAPFTQAQNPAGARRVHELGLLLEGPVLMLGSLACGDGVDLRDSSATQDDVFAEPNRQKLHERLVQMGHTGLICDLGRIEAQVLHG